jgi:hypothetical protein
MFVLRFTPLSTPPHCLPHPTPPLPCLRLQVLGQVHPDTNIRPSAVALIISMLRWSERRITTSSHSNTALTLPPAITSIVAGVDPVSRMSPVLRGAHLHHLPPSCPLNLTSPVDASDPVPPSLLPPLHAVSICCSTASIIPSQTTNNQSPQTLNLQLFAAFSAHAAIRSCLVNCSCMVNQKCVKVTLTLITFNPAPSLLMTHRFVRASRTCGTHMFFVLASAHHAFTPLLSLSTFQQ